MRLKAIFLAPAILASLVSAASAQVSPEIVKATAGEWLIAAQNGRPGCRVTLSAEQAIGGHALATHVVNGVNLLFPAGERFFVRSVRHFLDAVEDPALRAQVRGFAGQEGWHAQAHEAFFRVLGGGAC